MYCIDLPVVNLVWCHQANAKVLVIAIALLEDVTPHGEAGVNKSYQGPKGYRSKSGDMPVIGAKNITWTPITRAQHNRTGLRDGSDLINGEWRLLSPSLPPPLRLRPSRFTLSRLHQSPPYNVA